MTSYNTILSLKIFAKQCIGAPEIKAKQVVQGSGKIRLCSQMQNSSFRESETPHPQISMGLENFPGTCTLETIR